MRYLGIDFGSKRIGLAVSDELGLIAGTYGTHERKGVKTDTAKIASIVQEKNIRKVIVGFPRNMDGSIGGSARRVEDFVKSLQQILDIPVETWDERLSTVSAQRVLIKGEVRRKKRKKVVDQLAAVIILQNYLDYSNLSHP
jgi:putative Holliday junction resolvase